MISVAAVLSVRNYPSMAEEGWALILWYFFGAFFFLLPLALVSAELASAWPKEGGVYAWVEEAFGTKTGFMSIWSVFAENIPWYPTVLSFIAVTIAYIFNPDLANNHLFVAVVMLVVWWGLTAVNLLGPSFAARFSSIGTILGSVIPSIVLIALGVAWLVSGKSTQLPPFSFQELVPTWDIGTLVFSSTVILTFAGIEMSGYYALQVENPRRDYPIAIFLATIIVFSLSVFGTLPIALAVDVKELSLAGGVMQTFETIFKNFGISWMTPIMGVLLGIGALALMSTWMLGPSLSMVPVSKQGLLPPFFRRLNRGGAPVRTLIMQGVVTSILILIMILIPSMDSAYWILSSFTTTLLVLYYLPVFAAVIKLRYTQPDTERPFKVWGGVAGVWIVAGIGTLSLLFAGFMALNRPSTITMVSPLGYLLFMVIGTLIWMLPYFYFVKFKKADWKVKDTKKEA